MKRKLPALLILVLIVGSYNATCQIKIDYQKTGDTFFENKDYKGAIDSYTKAISISEQNKQKLAILLDKRAQVEIDLEQYKKAIEDETAAILANPNYADAYWNRGLAYGKSKEYQLAINDYTKTMVFYKDDKDNLSTLYDNRGINERKLKQYQKAIDDHSQAIALNNKNGDAYWHRGIAYNNNHQYQLAIDDYTTAMFYNQEDRKDLAMLYENRAVNERRLKKYKEAINDFNTASQLNPGSRDIYWERGLTYQYNSDYQLAINDFTSAISYYQNDKNNEAILYNNMAINAMALHQAPKALEYVSKAIERNPQNGYFYWSRGGIYSQTGESKKAIDDFTKAMDFYKDNKRILAALHSEKAANFYILNQNQQVIDECDTAIAFYPANANPYFTRGKVYLKRIVNKDKALLDFNKVISLDTSKATVGYIFSQFYIGNTELAMQKLQEQVLKTVSADDVLNHYYNIACMFSIMNKPDEANIYLKKAIDSGYSKKFAANDEDFDNIRKTPDYIALMASGDSK
ncbi:tetratricopeptide repeat protein [Mucilaginibacter pocheonensis]|uniref:Tetratricopeptide (TPR) repeat protein n=1 Tax=Mucilaginibacter pocheonensis TaxID=398050 RepID=A0ABU1T937_9SPHI|nr:tetratricopeptide repeat protein [Mucilaginibacter pocheonensis]MDR6941741.1 tetratricopeptide (TPR) repeat protein [Mucilaginibacter pocheonensis]